MNKRKAITLTYVIALTLLALAVTAERADAQDYVAPEVIISKDKVKIDGKVFYSHIVLEKQTLFSISKAYNVSIEDIYRYNPSLEVNGLRKNDIIIIPAQDNARTHVVKWYEDLFSISVKYGVSEEDIMAANNLQSKKLKVRQELIIPDGPVEKTVVESAPQETVAAIETTTEEIHEATETEEITTETYEDQLETVVETHKVNATLIMPLKATGTTSSRNNMDFYSGVLLAAREITDKGINIHLDVYDIAAGNLEIPERVLRNSDMIIGPVSPGDINRLYSILDSSCPVISPLDQRVEKLVSQYSNLIQVPASQDSQFADVACWIKEDVCPDDKIIVISEKEARQNDAGKVLRQTIDKSGLTYTPFSYSILEGRDIQPALEAVMTREGVNRVVIASESEAFVNDVVRNLNLIIHNKFNTILYGPAKIRSFETIEVENFHNTSLHASLTYNIDYDDDRVKRFIMRYRAMFGTEPTQFAFQGYDLARYFIMMAAVHGKSWPEMLEKSGSEMMQSRTEFKRTENGSYVNKGIRRIIYGKDYTIINLN